MHTESIVSKFVKELKVCWMPWDVCCKILDFDDYYNMMDQS